MKAALPGMPAKLHAPGKPWHKTKVRLRRFFDGRWHVLVRSWSRKALRENPAVAAIHVITVDAEQFRLLPGTPYEDG